LPQVSAFRSPKSEICNMNRLGALFLVALTTVVFGAEKLSEDEPTVRPPRAGDVIGKLSPPEKVSQIWAVSRVTGARYEPASFDKRTGEFRFEKLPGDATYDICIRAADGRNIEGIDLDFVDARLLRLAEIRRKQLDLPPERSHEFSRADARAIIDHVGNMKDFLEYQRVLYVRGHGRRATVLLERMRMREFYASRGELVWRMELWYFEERRGGWERLMNQERVLRRKRITPDEWRKVNVEYYPALSVHVDETGYAPKVRFAVPDKADPSRGRPSTALRTGPAGSEVELKTTPHVDGLDVKDKPATKPTSRRSTTGPVPVGG